MATREMCSPGAELGAHNIRAESGADHHREPVIYSELPPHHLQADGASDDVRAVAAADARAFVVATHLVANDVANARALDPGTIVLAHDGAPLVRADDVAAVAHAHDAGAEFLAHAQPYAAAVDGSALDGPPQYEHAELDAHGSALERADDVRALEHADDCAPDARAFWVPDAGADAAARARADAAADVHTFVAANF